MNPPAIPVAPRASFDRLAGVYRALEYLAFGRDLERARFGLLGRLRDCEAILVLGEGDGRCLAQLVRAAPRARIHCVDASAAMLARAAARAQGAGAAERVTFQCADIFQAELPPGAYDAAVTLFFLDCFSPEQTGEIVRRVQRSLRPGAGWLFADFVLPPRGLARLRARLWLRGLYLFFRWQTGLRTRALPPAEEILRAAGFRPEAVRDYQWGLVRSTFMSQPGSRLFSSSSR